MDVNTGPVRGVSDRDSDMPIQISFKLSIIVDLYREHMHVNWSFDPIQDGQLAAIFVSDIGTIWGDNSANNGRRDSIPKRFHSKSYMPHPVDMSHLTLMNNVKVR